MEHHQASQQVQSTQRAFGAVTPTTTRQKLNVLTDPKAVLCAYLYKRLPRTSSSGNSIAGMFRPDLLLATATPQDYAHVSAFPEEAFVEFSYEEGFPALAEGRPIWMRLPWESENAFAAFDVYLNSVEEGPRQVADLLYNGELLQIMGEELTLENLRNSYYLYYWKDRVRAYDLYKEASYRHIRMRRALHTEDHAYVQATAMLSKLNGTFEKQEFWDQLGNDPKVALDFFDKLIKIRRVAAGLPAAAPEEDQRTSSFELVMRKVQEEVRAGEQQGSLESGVTVDASGRVLADGKDFLRDALQDPRTAKMTQELIIKMTQQSGATRQPRWASRTKARDTGDEGGDEGEGGNGTESEENMESSSNISLDNLPR